MQRMTTLLLMVLAGAASCAGQDVRAAIVGRVTDPTGAVVVGARVRVVNAATNATASSETNQSGNFQVPYLLPGSYRVTVEAPGFTKSVREDIELRVGDRVTLDFVLQVGDVTQSVVVTGETPLLEVASASVGTVMDAKRLAELPTMGGNTIYLARLAKGVVSTGQRHVGYQQWDMGAGTGGSGVDIRLSVNGTPAGSTQVTLDGTSNMARYNIAFSPPQDLVQEYKVETAAYDAGAGYATGASITVTTKSGTNEFHGTSNYFDSRLQTRDWFDNRWIYDPKTGPITQAKKDSVKSTWREQRWGTTFTGPVLIPRLYNGRNRTFFSFGYEGADFLRGSGAGPVTVPTPEQKRGDFSALLKAGASYQIYDPRTIAAAPNGRFSRQPLAGNIIPASRIDPIARNIVSYYPDPNAAGTIDGRNNFQRLYPTSLGVEYRAFIARADHNFSDKHRAFLRLNEVTSWFGWRSLPTIASGSSGYTNRPGGYGAVLDDVYVFSPQLLLNVRYGLTRQEWVDGALSAGFDLASLGFSRSLLDEINRKAQPAGITFPQITVDGGGYHPLGASGGQSRTLYYHNLATTLTKISRSHSTRIGYDLRVMRENGYNFGNVSPAMVFSNTWTRGPLDNSPAAPLGQGLASLMMGYPTGGKIDVNDSRAEQSMYHGLYFQDDWRVTPRLTLNFGLRWEVNAPVTERFNRSVRGFDFQTANPIEAEARANYAKNPIAEVPVSAFRTPGGLLFAGAGGQPRALWTADRNNFAPRIGLAFQAAKKTVIRSGYGIFYVPLGVDSLHVNQAGFNKATDLIPSLDNGLTFRATMANPFPDGLQLAPGASGGLRTNLGQGVSFFPERPLNGYMQRWSFNIQHELPGRLLLDAGYVGNRGTKLSATRQINALPAQYLSKSAVRDTATINFLSQQVPNPFYGVSGFAGTSLGNLRVARRQLLAPYPHFTEISVSVPDGFSYYHSLQLSVEKRLAKGLTFQTNYAWSKFMEAVGYLNPSDLRPYKVISASDFPHRLSVNAIYELPVGRGRPLLGSAAGVTELFLGGWQVEGWYEGQSGAAFGFGNAIFRGNLKDIPLPVSKRKAERWFNIDAGFDRNPSNRLADNIIGLSPRFNNVRADGLNACDLGVSKTVRITERFKAAFRAQAFNAFNHPMFRAPVSDPYNSAFGSVTSSQGEGTRRTLVFGLKVSF